MRTIFLFLFFGSTLFSNAFEPDPSIIVDGCVNPLTGDYFIKQDDVFIDGKFPLILTRVYSSQTKKWELTPHTRLVLKGEKQKPTQEKKKKKKKKEKKPTTQDCIYRIVQLKEPTGQLLTYRLASEEHFTLEVPPGAINTTQKILHASTSPHNQQLFRQDAFTFKLITPEKIERLYTKAYTQNLDLYFLLRSEHYPDGHFVLYEYDHLHRPLCIKCTDSTQTQIISACQFRYFDRSSYEITTSDGQKLIHHFNGLALSSVQSSSRPEETFEYAQGDLHKRAIRGGKISRIDYLPDGKVHTLRNEYGNPMHTFSYFPTYTEVLHADKSKTRYSFAIYPEKIEEFDSHQNLQKSVSVQWNSRGEFISKTTRDNQGTILSHHTICYDQRGNPIEENLDGKTCKRIFDEHDRITLFVSDKHTHYEYLDNTDLVTSIALGTSEKIWIRILFGYDPSYILNKVTLTDGAKKQYKMYTLEGRPDCLRSVTESVDGQVLKKICYREERGQLLEEIYDGENHLFSIRPITASEILRPWDIYFPFEEAPEGGEVERDFFGRIIALRFYDPSGLLLREKCREYDTFNLLAYVDLEGIVTRYLYDNRGQKEKEIIETSNGPIETSFFYDPIGRLEKIQTGELLTCYRYNEEGQPYEIMEETSSGKCIGKRPFARTDTPQKPLLKIKEGPGIQKIHDSLGQLIELFTDDETVHYTLEYNKRGQITSITDHVHPSIGTRHYDDLGNLVEEILLKGLTFQNTYDLRGRRTLFTLPDHSFIHYRFGPKYLEEIQRVPLDDASEYRHRFTTYDLSGIPISQRMLAGFGELSLDVDESAAVCGIHTRYYNETLDSPPVDEFNTPHKTYEFQCDGLGRITQITQPNRQIHFTYDIWNRRMTKLVYECEEEEWSQTESLLYLYDDQKDIGAMEDGALKQLRVLTPQGDQAIGMELENLVYAPVHDLQGNVKLLISTVRNKVIESYTFSPSGREKITDYWEDLIPESKAKNPWRYLFERTDDETGLVYINGDYYDPIIQKFISHSLVKMDKFHGN